MIVAKNLEMHIKITKTFNKTRPMMSFLDLL